MGIAGSLLPVVRGTVVVANDPPWGSTDSRPKGTLNLTHRALQIADSRVPASAGLRAGMSPLPGGR